MAQTREKGECNQSLPWPPLQTLPRFAGHGPLAGAARDAFGSWCADQQPYFPRLRKTDEFVRERSNTGANPMGQLRESFPLNFAPKTTETLGFLVFNAAL